MFETAKCVQSEANTDASPLEMTKDTTPTLRPSIAQSDALVHLIYDAATDNSLWPELVSSIYQTFEQANKENGTEDIDLEALQLHFARGLYLSEKVVALQEESELQRRTLENMPVKVHLYDRTGTSLSPQRASGVVHGATLDPPATFNVPETLDQSQAEDGAIVFGPDQIHRLGLPEKVGWARVSLERRPEDIVNSLPGIEALPASRHRLLVSFLKFASLKDAARSVSLSYETARTYMKDIYGHFGVSGQAELLKEVLLTPSAFMPAPSNSYRGKNTRYTVPRPEGGQIEYFALGPSEGYPLLHFDALSGGALDILGVPDRYRPLLERLGIRLILPCRPGTFGTTPLPVKEVADYANDIKTLCDALRIDRFSIFAYSHGTVAALGVAHAMRERVDRITIGSACFPDYVAPNWRELDFFYHISRIIGRKWPALQRRLIPFLIKSIIQNVDTYADRAAERSNCEHEAAILRDPEIRQRSRAMLAGRVANGMEGMVQEYQLAAQPLDLKYEQLQMPVQIFHGECDQINPVGGARSLASVLPNAALRVLPEMGHAFVYAEWDWLLMASIGQEVQTPTAWRRGILKEA